jgi:hypothetical protein
VAVVAERRVEPAAGEAPEAGAGPGAEEVVVVVAREVAEVVAARVEVEEEAEAPARC